MIQYQCTRIIFEKQMGRMRRCAPSCNYQPAGVISRWGDEQVVIQLLIWRLRATSSSARCDSVSPMPAAPAAGHLRVVKKKEGRARHITRSEAIPTCRLWGSCALAP